MYILLDFIWVTVALALWISYKLEHGDEHELWSPPQATFVGALMWPFYLAGYVVDRAKHRRHHH